MTETDTHVYFYGGPFSQWYSSPFKPHPKVNIIYTNNLKDYKFPTAEHWMMYCKAILFANDEIAEQILMAKTPSLAKQFGRKVKNFDVDDWEMFADRIVYEGNILKFRQNPKLLTILVNTGNKTLVEASPYDKIWGVGLNETDPRILDETKWLGANRLGIALMKVREKLNVEV